MLTFLCLPKKSLYVGVMGSLRETLTHRGQELGCDTKILTELIKNDSAGNHIQTYKYLHEIGVTTLQVEMDSIWGESSDRLDLAKSIDYLTFQENLVLSPDKVQVSLVVLNGNGSPLQGIKAFSIRVALFHLLKVDSSLINQMSPQARSLLSKKGIQQAVSRSREIGSVEDPLVSQRRKSGVGHGQSDCR